MKTFGEKLVALRAERGYSQTELGERAGITRRTIVSYENDGRQPYPAQLYKLATALGVSPEYLRNDECEDPNFASDSSPYVEAAYKRFGVAGAMDVEQLMQQNNALFAGGELSQEAKDAYFQAVMKAYLACKEKSAAASSESTN